MGESARGNNVTLTLALGLVVCTFLTQWSGVAADECGTKFVDPTSSTVLAHVVLQGSIQSLNQLPGRRSSQSANVTVTEVYKGMEVLKRVSPSADMVMVSEFGQEDKERCVMSTQAMSGDSPHVFFLRQTSDRNMLQMSALPLPMEKKVERKVKRSLCNTCVRPPRIKRLMCKDCAREPRIRDMKPRKVKMGKRARLRCVAQGRPDPTIIWRKDGIPISSGSGGVTIRNTSSSSILIFRKTSSAHRGLYTCIATNGAGTAEKQVHLDVVSARPSKPKKSKNNAAERVKCQTNPCLNGGTCYLKADSDLRFCACTEGYEGVQCENQVGNGATDSGRARQRGNSILRTPVESFPNQSHTTGTNTNHSSSDPDTVNPIMHQEKTIPREQPSTSVNSAAQNSNINKDTSESSDSIISPQTRQPSQSTSTSSLPRQRPGNSNTDTATQSRGSESEAANTDGSRSRASTSERQNSERELQSSYDINRLKSRLNKSHLKIVYCKDKSFCQNGGRCKYIRKLDVKFCECPTGTHGKNCQFQGEAAA